MKLMSNMAPTKIGQQNKKKKLRYSPVVLTLGTAFIATLLLLFSACYWQPDDDGTGELAVSVQIPVPQGLNTQGELGALNYSGPGEFAIMVFDEAVFRGPDGYTVLNYIMSNDPNWLVNLAPYGRIHYTELDLSVGSTGSVTFSGLTAGRSYSVIAWAWAAEEEGPSPSYYEALDISSVTITGGQSTAVTLGLGEEYPKLMTYMVGYGVPVVQAFAANGLVEDETGPNVVELFEVTGVAIEYLGQVGTAYRHHLYMYDAEAAFNMTSKYNPNAIGAGRLSLQSNFAELILVTTEPLLFEWVGMNGLPIFDFGGTVVPRVERATISTIFEEFVAIGDLENVDLYSDGGFEINFLIDGFNGNATWGAF